MKKILALVRVDNGFDTLEEVEDARDLQAVENLLAASFIDNNSCLLEYIEVFGDCGHVVPYKLLQITDTALPS